MAVETSFIEKSRAQWAKGKFLSVGLDPDMDKLPDQYRGVERSRAQFEFMRKIVEATAPIAGFFKPNIAFFEDHPDGLVALKSIMVHIKQTHPDIPVIGDIKRADIGNTNRGYAKAAFDYFGFDAITTNPYFGHDTFAPFTEGKYEGKGLIPLVKTSNPGSGLYQDTPTSLLDYKIMQESLGTPLTDKEEKDLAKASDLYEQYYLSIGVPVDQYKIPLHAIIARRIASLSALNPNIGIVMGLTHPEHFDPIRELVDDTYMLIPGMGTQEKDGDLEMTLKFAPDSKGQGIIVNNGSAIIFASRNRDFHYAARDEAIKSHERITRLMRER